MGALGEREAQPQAGSCLAQPRALSLKSGVNGTCRSLYSQQLWDLVGQMGCSLNPLLLRPGWPPRSRGLGLPAQPTISSSCLLLDRLPEAHKGPQMEFWAMHCCALGPRPAGSRHYKPLALPLKAFVHCPGSWLAAHLPREGRGKPGSSTASLPHAPFCFPTSHLLVFPDKGCPVGRVFPLPHHRLWVAFLFPDNIMRFQGLPPPPTSLCISPPRP